jgi:hypothetical protein
MDSTAEWTGYPFVYSVFNLFKLPHLMYHEAYMPVNSFCGYRERPGMIEGMETKAII